MQNDIRYSLIQENNLGQNIGIGFIFDIREPNRNSNEISVYDNTYFIAQRTKLEFNKTYAKMIIKYALSRCLDTFLKGEFEEQAKSASMIIQRSSQFFVRKFIYTFVNSQGI